MNRICRKIGLLEVFGGVLVIVGHLLSVFQRGGTPWFVLWTGLAFGALGIVAGALLLRQTAPGVPLSIAVQAAQVVSFSSGWRYVAYAGPRLTWVIASTGTGVEFGGGGVFTITPTPPDGTLAGVGLHLSTYAAVMGAPLASATWTLGINLVALYLLVRLVGSSDGIEAPAQDEHRVVDTVPPAS